MHFSVHLLQMLPQTDGDKMMKRHPVELCTITGNEKWSEAASLGQN
jgi:hypothetical protein